MTTGPKDSRTAQWTGTDSYLSASRNCRRRPPEPASARAGHTHERERDRNGTREYPSAMDTDWPRALAVVTRAASGGAEREHSMARVRGRIAPRARSTVLPVAASRRTGGGQRVSSDDLGGQLDPSSLERERVSARTPRSQRLRSPTSLRARTMTASRSSRRSGAPRVRRSRAITVGGSRTRDVHGRVTNGLVPAGARSGHGELRLELVEPFLVTDRSEQDATTDGDPSSSFVQRACEDGEDPLEEVSSLGIDPYRHRVPLACQVIRATKSSRRAVRGRAGCGDTAPSRRSSSARTLPDATNRRLLRSTPRGDRWISEVPVSRGLQRPPRY